MYFCSRVILCQRPAGYVIYRSRDVVRESEHKRIARKRFRWRTVVRVGDKNDVPSGTRVNYVGIDRERTERSDFAFTRAAAFAPDENVRKRIRHCTRTVR